MMEKRKEKTMSQKYKNIPILKIKLMTDEEWNRLAYKQYIQNTDVSNGRA